MAQKVNLHPLHRKIACCLAARIGLIAFGLATVIIAAQAQPKIAGCAVFPANNIWNAPVDRLPVDVNSNSYVATIGATQPAHPDFGSGLWDGGPIGIPFITVPGTQAKVAVTFDYDSESDHGGYPVPSNAPIEGGSASTGDRHVLVVDRDNCMLYELYAAYPQSDGSWHAGSGAIFDLKSNALRPAGWTSADAAGLPIFPGLLRYDEVAGGEIQHAVRFTAPQTRNTYLWPARHQASDLSALNYPPMGQRFRLKAGFDIAGYAPTVQVILRGLKKYGMILADNGSSWYIGGAPDDRWDNDTLHQITQLQGSDFEAVAESSLMAQPDSAAVRSTAAPIVNAVVNAGSFAPGPIAPGEILSIFGSGFNADAKVTFDGTAGPVIYASPLQINVVAPYEIDGKASTSIAVNIDGTSTTPQTLPVAAAAPGIFIVLNQDYSANTPAHPAAAGSVLVVYATGEGQTRPAGVDGKLANGPASTWPKPLLTVSATVGGKNAGVLYAGAAPGYVAGLMQINLKLPAGVASGTWPLVLHVGSFSTNVTVAIR
ncbi:MAG TPA: IPT/TIG domain-containing protein [Bryobacteraceae bacterium]|nr:IPT/TIG domain-containing protein [Bryobacteraceae bacterium]